MTDNNHVYDMIIIGGGPAGYTAALYAARAGFDTLVLERLSAGGQMALSLSGVEPIRFISANICIYFRKNSCNMPILLQIFSSSLLNICSI